MSGTASLFFSQFNQSLPKFFLSSLRLCVSAVIFPAVALAQGLPLATPQSVGMNAAKLAQIEQLVNADVADKKLPGAVIVVGHKGKIVYRKAFGNRSLVPTVEKMTVDTIFDVASLTKPVATATSIMILMEQGKLRLNDTIGKYIPDIDDEQAKRVTIQQLLTHTSGYAPDFDLKEKWTGREGMLAALKKEKLRTPPGTKFVYSDIGFIVLGEIARRNYPSIAGGLTYPTGFDFFVDFARKESFRKLGMTSTFIFSEPWMAGSVDAMLERENNLSRIAPTENIRGQNSYLGSTFDGDETAGRQILRGTVHDPTSYRMGGVAGHAGLFSTADDLARYCQMLLNGGLAPDSPPSKGGVVDASAEGGGLSSRRKRPPEGGTQNNGKRPSEGGTQNNGKRPPEGGTQNRILSAETVARMTAPIVVSEDGATRGLGWDINTAFSSNRGELFPLGSFGHTGFTGTSIWIDRVSQTFVVFMSNRVHPDGKGDVTPLRAKVATIVASAVEDIPVEAYRLAESMYASQVAAQIPKFKANLEAAARTNSAIRTPQSAIVLNGIDMLEKNNFKDFEGKRIGLVTNHTGRNFAGKPTIDVLFEAKNVKLVSLFAPEHGIRGELDTEKIDDTKDEKTGLPVYSLYKDGMRRPKPEQLKDLDAIIYDIQDVGARFYTYTATLKNVMEESAKAKLPIYVLDRPNPINGVSVEGSLAEEDKLNFIAAHTIPVRYGLTIGELGMMMNTERKIGADVRVIKMDNWSRSMWFDETGQTWINPSPNMRSLNEATLYPGIGLLETSNVSVGRGTDTPFEIVGAPWIDGQKLAKYLNERRLPGVRFVPVRFKPNASVFKGEDLGGVNVIVTDRGTFESVRTGIEFACALRKLYPTDWEVDRYGRLLVNGEILGMVKRGESPEAIEAAWQKSLEEFKKRRAPYLLYK